MLHFIVLDTDTPHVFDHSTYIMFLMNRQQYLANYDVRVGSASASPASGP